MTGQAVKALLTASVIRFSENLGFYRASATRVSADPAT